MFRLGTEIISMDKTGQQITQCQVAQVVENMKESSIDAKREGAHRYLAITAATAASEEGRGIKGAF